jgi:hypothetical protein
MHHLRTSSLKSPALLAALALVFTSWSPVRACACSPCGVPLEGASAGCCAGQPLCQSCRNCDAVDGESTDCLADGGCLCHPASAPTAEQPRALQADGQVALACAVLPSSLAGWPAATDPPLPVAGPASVSSGAELRVLYCSRLE